MNKQDLKSLLENIYEAMILPTLGDEALRNPSLLDPYRNDPARNPNWTPNVLYPLGDGWTWIYVNGYWRAYPPVATPLPPKPTPNLPGYNPADPHEQWLWEPDDRPNSEQWFRDFLRREFGPEAERQVYP